MSAERESVKYFFIIKSLESIFPALVGTQKLQGNRVCGQRTNDGKHRPAEREGEEQVPEARPERAPVGGRQDVRLAQQRDALRGQRERSAEQGRAHGVRREKYRHERK